MRARLSPELPNDAREVPPEVPEGVARAHPCPARRTLSMFAHDADARRPHLRARRSLRVRASARPTTSLGRNDRKSGPTSDGRPLVRDVPLNIELKLEVVVAHFVGIVIDAVRCAKLGLDNGVSERWTAGRVLHEVAAGSSIPMISAATRSRSSSAPTRPSRRRPRRSPPRPDGRCSHASETLPGLSVYADRLPPGGRARAWCGHRAGRPRPPGDGARPQLLDSRAAGRSQAAAGAGRR